MRLICPNCGAQYEVAASVIPDDGRDVQCSNCGNSWFQQPETMDEELASERGYAIPDTKVEPEAAPQEPEFDEFEEDLAPAVAAGAATSRLSDSVKSILQEEASFELNQRTTSVFEEQQDLGIEEAPQESKAQALRERVSRLRGGEAAMDDPVDDSTGRRRDLLPDIEEIKSSLNAAEERPEELAPFTFKREKKKKSGFRFASILVLLAAVLGIAAYALAPKLAAQFPAFEPQISAFVEWANGGRDTLSGLLEKATVWLNSVMDNPNA